MSIHGVRTPTLYHLLICVTVYTVVSSQDPASSTTATTPDDIIPIPAISHDLKLSVDDELSDKTVSAGDRLTLDCAITGYPTPIYKWFKDGELIDQEDRHYIMRLMAWGHRLRLQSTSLSDAGTYTCEGSNLAGSKNSSARVTVEAAPRTTTVTPAGVVPPVSKSDGTVLTDPFCQDYRGTYCSFLNSKEVYVTSRLDQNRAETKVIELVRRLTDINLLATSKCFQKSVEATCYDKMPVCAQRIAAPPIPRKLCRMECEALFPLCKEDFGSDSTKWSLLPDCSQLDNSAGCVRIGLSTVTEQVPPDVVGDVKTDKPVEETSDVLIIIVCISLAVLLMVVVAIIIICVRRNHQKSRGSNSLPSSAGSQGKSVELSSLSEKAAIYIKDVSLDNVNRLQELGSGSYGKVYHGQVFGLYGNNTASAAFIKCLDENSSAAQVADFRDEAASMSEVRHQNVVSLLAVSTKGITQCLIYEFLQLGDLRQFLLSQQSHGHSLTCRETMYIVTQVAAALEYLSSQHFIHKDIAAHNVIVSHNLNVKLSNLKIIHGVYSSNYCTIHNKMLPIRWLPPESITYDKFSLETDVYSYGVFLWEAFSEAQQPYAGFSNQEVIEMVRSRELLPCPSSCPTRLYSLMMECWHENPNKRPTAKEVHQKMRAWYLDNSYAISTTTGPSAASGSTCTAPSHHSSTGPGPATSVPNSNHTNLTDTQSNEPVRRPGYLQTSTPDNVPYYSTIDQYKPGLDSPTSCSSFDNTSEYTESNVVPNTLPPNYYSSTPMQRYTSLSRRKGNNPDLDFTTQTTPLFQQTDQV